MYQRICCCCLPYTPLEGQAINDAGDGRLLIPRERPPINQAPEPPPYRTVVNEHFPLETRVRFLIADNYYGGTVVWTGTASNYQDGFVDDFSAVVRLDGEAPGATNGMFNGQQLVPAGRGEKFLLVHSTELEKVKKINDGDFCYLQKKRKELSFTGGFARRKDGASFAMWPIDTDYRRRAEANPTIVYDFFLWPVPPPISEEVCDQAAPISPQQLTSFLGRNKGIQGHNNSCYLDTILFSFFALSDSFDSLIFEDNADYKAWEAISILRYQIVLPLRVHQYVSRNHITDLRDTVATHSGQAAFTDDIRDIQECVETLFKRILSSSPWLALGQLNGEETQFQESFSIDIVDVDFPIPNIQYLLDQASVTMNFCLKEMSKHLLIQLPREKYHNTVVIPSLQLDLANILFKSRKQCCSCFSAATLRFPEKVQFGDLSKSLFCHACATKKKLDISESVRLGAPEKAPKRSTIVHMKALICIEVAHYNAFVRCGEGPQQRWVFFDSMHDQEELYDPKEKKTKVFNIPVVEEVKKFRHWIDEAPKYLRTDGNLHRLFNSLEGTDRERCKRIFTCPYTVIYEADPRSK